MPGTQPIDTLFRNFIAGGEGGGERTPAAVDGEEAQADGEEAQEGVRAFQAASPAAALQPHHFLVAWRRDIDHHLSRLLHPSDFRSHGSPSPVVHPHQRAGLVTPGLPAGVNYDSFQYSQ